MSKIIYHKQYRKHLPVKRLKAMMIKYILKIERFQPSIYIELTGVLYEDISNLRYYLKEHIEKLNKNITKELADNKEDSSIGYSTREYLERTKFIEEMSKWISFASNEYPEEWFELKIPFSSSSLTYEQKKIEYSDRIKGYHLCVFNKEFYSYIGENQKRLWPLTMSESDFIDIEGIILKYQ